MKINGLTAVLTASAMALSTMTVSAGGETDAAIAAEAVSMAEMANMPEIEGPADVQTLSNEPILPLGVIMGNYNNNSYYTRDHQPCSSHAGCTWTKECNCMNYDASIQCAAFAKYIFYHTRRKKCADGDTVYENESIDTGDKAKNLLMGVPQGTYVRGWLKKGLPHSIAILSTSDTGITTYEANYDGHCGVRIQTWKWEDFSQYMTYIYMVVE